MRKLGFFLALFLFANNVFSFAQSDYSRITNFPLIRELHYDEGTKYGSSETNIPRFFNEWVEWSKLISQGALDNPYNEIFTKYFRKYYGDTNTMYGGDKDCKHVALPERIKVVKFNCNIHPDSLKLKKYDWATEIATLFHIELPESISYFTPKIEMEKPVVYLTTETIQVLDSFIDEPINKKNLDSIEEKDWEELRKRRDMIREYLPALSAHWGDGWFYYSNPLIGGIIVGNDGYYVYVSDANYSGFTVFVSWDGEERVTDEWIQ